MERLTRVKNLKKLANYMLKMHKRIIAVVLAVLLAVANLSAVAITSAATLPTSAIATSVELTGLATYSAAGSVKAFPDVESTNWAYESIYKLLNTSVVAGYPDGTFGPARTITRAEFTKMLIAPLNFDLNSTTSSFSDVSATNWASKYIEAAQSNGLLYNDGTGKFNPNVPITREYVAFMVGKAIEMSVSPLKIAMGMGFSDTNTIRKDFVSAVATTVDYGIVKGYPDGTFGPKKNITRAEASKIMTMGIELICDTTLAMPGIEQTAYAWVAEDVNGTTEVRKCDGVTRRLVKTEQEEAIVFFPLTSVSQWEPWGTTRYVNQGDDLMIEAISKGLVLERQKIGLAPEGGNTTYYSYMQNIAYETVLTYFYEVYKPITKTVVSTKDSI